MPRGKKAAPSTAPAAVSKAAPKPVSKRAPKAAPPPPVQEAKTRKPRTTDPDERIALVDKRIEELNKTIADRRELIAKTEVTQNQRRDALQKNEEMLSDAQAKRARIVASKEAGGTKALNRQTKAEEKAKMAALLEAIKASGKSLDDVLAEFAGDEG